MVRKNMGLCFKKNFKNLFDLHHIIPHGVGAGDTKIEDPGAGAAKNGRLRNTGLNWTLLTVMQIPMFLYLRIRLLILYSEPDSYFYLILILFLFLSYS